jgi:hypothetical protein
VSPPWTHDAVERVQRRRCSRRWLAFILDAIAQTVEQVELDDAFRRVAEERWAHLLTTGKTVPWADAKAYLESRARGGQPRKPLPRKPSR